MKNNKHLPIISRIILMFAAIIIMSFIPESNREFFGDFKCDGSFWNPTTETHTGCLYQGTYGTHPPTWHWGFRHWAWMFMGLSLTIYSICLIVYKIDKLNRQD